MIQYPCNQTFLRHTSLFEILPFVSVVDHLIFFILYLYHLLLFFPLVSSKIPSTYPYFHFSLPRVHLIFLPDNCYFFHYSSSLHLFPHSSSITSPSFIINNIPSLLHPYLPVIPHYLPTLPWRSLFVFRFLFHVYVSVLGGKFCDSRSSFFSRLPLLDNTTTQRPMNKLPKNVLWISTVYFEIV